eukprot:6201739-Pleurochrysis_carterae.AAC.3
MRPSELSPVPLSHLLNEATGQLMPAILYTANKRWRGAQPRRRQKAGHGSHLTRDLIEFCCADHTPIILRVPHTSHLMQGEHLANFKHFKVLADCKGKHARFAQLFAQHKSPWSSSQSTSCPSSHLCGKQRSGRSTTCAARRQQESCPSRAV